jgi:hypothetical protein
MITVVLSSEINWWTCTILRFSITSVPINITTSLPIVIPFPCPSNKRYTQHPSSPLIEGTLPYPLLPTRLIY